MGLQGYVGSGEDVRRIRRQEQQLEEERKKRETEKQQREANVSAAGFRQFGKGAAEVFLAVPVLLYTDCKCLSQSSVRVPVDPRSSS